MCAQTVLKCLFMTLLFQWNAFWKMFSADKYNTFAFEHNVKICSLLWTFNICLRSFIRIAIVHCEYWSFKYNTILRELMTWLIKAVHFLCLFMQCPFLCCIFIPICDEMYICFSVSDLLWISDQTAMLKRVHTQDQLNEGTLPHSRKVFLDRN